MRIRTIKPEFWSHEGIAALPALTRLLFIGLWNLADRRGRLEDRPKRIKVQILPYDDADVDVHLDVLHQSGFITRYSSKGVQVVQVNGFEKHQRISGKEAEVESELPGMDGEAIEKQLGSTGEATGKHLGLQEGKGKERKGIGKEEEGGVGDSASPLPASPSAPSGDSEVIPAILDSPKFREAWTSWKAWRASFKKIKKPEKFFPMTLQWLSAPCRASDAIEILDQSIRNEWQGLFDLKGNHATKPQPNSDKRNLGIESYGPQFDACHDPIE